MNQLYGWTKGKVKKKMSQSHQAWALGTRCKKLTFTISAHLFWLLFTHCNACVELFAALPTDCWKNDKVVVALSAFSKVSLIFPQNNDNTDGYLSRLVLVILSCWILIFLWQLLTDIAITRVLSWEVRCATLWNLESWCLVYMRKFTSGVPVKYSCYVEMRQWTNYMLLGKTAKRGPPKCPYLP